MEREHKMRLRFMGNLKDEAGKKGLYSCQWVGSQVLGPRGFEGFHFETRIYYVALVGLNSLCRLKFIDPCPQNTGTKGIYSHLCVQMCVCV